jgi:hypothetical protein
MLKYKKWIHEEDSGPSVIELPRFYCRHLSTVSPSPMLVIVDWNELMRLAETQKMLVFFCKGNDTFSYCNYNRAIIP